MSKRSYIDPDACDVFHIHPARVAELRQSLIGADDVTELAETFHALGDPTRVRILDALSHGELCVCDLATLVGQSESAVSHQLRLLRAMRLVRSRRAGRMVFYALDDRHIVTLFRQSLRHVQERAGREVEGSASRARKPALAKSGRAAARPDSMASRFARRTAVADGTER